MSHSSYVCSTFTYVYAYTLIAKVAYILVGEDLPKDKDTPNWCKGVKVGRDGKLIVSVDYDTGAKNDGLNIYKFGSSGASLAWNVDRNELGLMMTRTQTRAEDGITHQGAIVVVLDGANMKMLKNLGRASAHSWFVKVCFNVACETYLYVRCSICVIFSPNIAL